MEAPTAMPRRGTKKSRPNRKPQNAPQVAAAPVVADIWWVFGFLFPWGQLTTAASSRLIICRSWRPCRAMSTLSAPLGSLNFSTESVAIGVSPLRWTARIAHPTTHCGINLCLAADFPWGPSYPNFLERRKGEVRRIHLPRTPVNKSFRQLAGSFSYLVAPRTIGAPLFRLLSRLL